MEKTLEIRVTELEQNIYQTKNILNFDEASKFLGMSKSSLYKMTSQSVVPHFKPQGKLIYFEREELENFLRQNPVKTQEQIAREAQKYIMSNKPLKR